MASPTWAEEARSAAQQTLTSLPALTGREEEWRFTPPADLALGGAEPEAPGASDVAGHLGRPPGGPALAGRRRARGAGARATSPRASSSPSWAPRSPTTRPSCASGSTA